eukprot:c48053_g1_i1 orf=255-455(+)
MHTFVGRVEGLVSTVKGPSFLILGMAFSLCWTFILQSCWRILHQGGLFLTSCGGGGWFQHAHYIVP